MRKDYLLFWPMLVQLICCCNIFHVSSVQMASGYAGTCRSIHCIFCCIVRKYPWDNHVTYSTCTGFMFSSLWQVDHDDVIKWKHFPHYWPLCGEFPGEFPAQRPVMRSFDVFFDLRPNKQLSKQSWGWWFEKPSCPFWRPCNVVAIDYRVTC